MKYAWRIIWLSSALFLAGCDLFPRLGGAKNDRPDPPPIAGAPSKHAQRVSQFVFLTEVAMGKNDPLFKDLSDLREHVYHELRLPPRNREIFVYLFEDKSGYEKFMKAKHPDLPVRRAYFIAEPTQGGEDLVVYTYKSDRLRKDLRHELTHALLHSVLKTVPIWLDEGLAEFFEVPAGQDGVNPLHVAPLRQADLSFDMNRLERLEEVHQMTPAEYRESWAWVHLMLRSTPQARQALLSYLQDLRVNARPAPLRPRLSPAFLSPENALRTHLADLERIGRADTTAKK